MRLRLLLFGFLAVFAAALVVVALRRPLQPSASEASGGERGKLESVVSLTPAPTVEPSGGKSDEDESRAEEEEDRLVDEFDDETDRWLDGDDSRLPTMEDIGNFLALFGRIPHRRKKECLQRALNLIPDENIILLVGILMDKSQDRDLVRLVYDDIINRDNSVKNSILQEIYKDKDHSCWSDTEWIFEVTGEKPEN